METPYVFLVEVQAAGAILNQVLHESIFTVLDAPPIDAMLAEIT